MSIPAWTLWKRMYDYTPNQSTAEEKESMAALNFIIAFTALIIAIMAYKKSGGSGS